jgi:hypothetical protein
MIYGDRLTEYTSEELQTLLNAIARETDHLLAYQLDQRVRAQIRHLEQWKTKVIEAKTEVRLKEIQTEN